MKQMRVKNASGNAYVTNNNYCENVQQKKREAKKEHVDFYYN